VKAILFFDELHFLDRPSMSFGGGGSQMLTIGAQLSTPVEISPLRRLKNPHPKSCPFASFPSY
jgi:hypothetical protein